MKSPALLITGPGRVALREIELPEPGPDDVLVENILTAISPGTELRCLGGEQEGRGLWPYVPGYAALGRVVSAGPGVGLEPGTLVVHTGTRRADGPVLWGGHSAAAVLVGANAFPVPPGLDVASVVAWRLAAIAYHGLRLARPLPHETVVVVGLGPIGHCAARLYAMTGIRTLALDTAPGRVEAARAAGLDARLITSNPRDTLADALPPGGADIIVDATGANAANPAAIDLAARLAWGDTPAAIPRLRYVFQGSYTGDIRLPYLPFFLREPTVLIPRSDQPSDTRAVLDLLARRTLSLDGIIGEIADPAAAEAVYDRLRARDTPLLTAAFRWRPDPTT